MDTCLLRHFLLLIFAVLSKTQNTKIGILQEGGGASVMNLIESVTMTINNDTRIFQPEQLLEYEMIDVGQSGPIEAGSYVCALLDKNVTSFLTITKNCNTRYYLENILLKLALPHVIVEEGNCWNPLSINAVTMHPPPGELGETVLQVIEQILQLPSLTIFYDHSVGVYIIGKLTKKCSQAGIKVRLLNMPQSDTELKACLHKLTNTSTPHKHMLVLCNKDNVFRVLNQANQEGLLSHDYHWILTGRNVSIQVLIKLTPAKSNIAFIHGQLSTDVSGSGGKFTCQLSLAGMGPATELEALTADGILTLAESYNLFLKAGEKWNWTGNSCSQSNQTVNNFTNIMRGKTVKTEGLSGGLRFSNNGYRNSVLYKMHSAYTSLDGVTSYKEVAEWTNGKLQLEAFNNIFPNTFSSFHHKELIIASREATPFIIRGPDLDPPYVKFTGFCIDILNELAEQFNFTYKMVESVDMKWGAPNPNGSWNGLVGMVKRGDVDFAVGPFTITQIRETVIDFTASFLQDGAGIIMKRPVEDNKEFRMFRPFHWTVWGLCSVTVLVVGVGLGIINTFSLDIDYNKKTGENGSLYLDRGFPGSLWLAFRVIVQQGAVAYPKTHSGRFLVAFYWFFVIIVMATYTADLVAYLTVPFVPKPIKSLDELTRQKAIKPLVKEGSNLYSLFQEAEGGTYKEIWDMMNDNPTVLHNSVGIDMAYDEGTWAFMTDYTQLEYRYNYDCEKFVLADELFNVAGYGFVLPDNAPYLKEFSQSIIKMREAGVIQRWKKRWWTTESGMTCKVSSTSNAALPLELQSCAGAFILVGCFTAVACLALAGELLFKYLYNKIRDNYVVNDVETVPTRTTKNNNMEVVKL